MRLFYTNTAKTDFLQQKATQSLGGFKSSSPVPNSSFGNLFSDLSLLTIEKNLPEYIGLILSNVRESKATNIKIWINNPSNNFCKFRLAVVELSTVNFFETLPSINSMPLFAEFHDTPSIEESISIPDMDIGDQYGIWVERSIDVDSDFYKNHKNCDFLEQTLALTLPNIEQMELKISFEDAAE